MVEQQAAMPSATTTGLTELRAALRTSAELRELRNRLAEVSAIGAKHARRLAGTLTAFLDSEDPSCFWYFPLLNHQLLVDVLSATLSRICVEDPDPCARTKAIRLMERLAES